MAKHGGVWQPLAKPSSRGGTPQFPHHDRERETSHSWRFGWWFSIVLHLGICYMAIENGQEKLIVLLKVAISIAISVYSRVTCTSGLNDRNWNHMEVWNVWSNSIFNPISVFVQLLGEQNRAGSRCQPASQDLPRRAPPRPTLGNYIHFPEARVWGSAIFQLHWCPQPVKCHMEGTLNSNSGGLPFCHLLAYDDWSCWWDRSMNLRLHFSCSGDFRVEGSKNFTNSCIEIKFWAILRLFMKVNIWYGETFSDSGLWRCLKILGSLRARVSQTRSLNVIWDQCLLRTAAAAQAKPCHPPPATRLERSSHVLWGSGCATLLWHTTSTLWVTFSGLKPRKHLANKLRDCLFVCSEVPALHQKHSQHSHSDTFPVGP